MALKRCIGIDPGITDLGWSFGIFDTDTGYYDVKERGIFNAGRKADKEIRKDEEAKAAGRTVVSVSFIWDHIEELYVKYEPDVVICEDNFFRKFVHPFRILVMIVNSIALMLWRTYRKPLYLVTPTAAKSGVCGDGHGKKLTIIKAISAHDMITMTCGAEGITSHEADSVAIGYSGAKNLF